MCNLFSRDIRQCTATEMQFRRVKQENHNPFTGTEISRGASAGVWRKTTPDLRFLYNLRITPARRPAMLVEDEHRARERWRHVAMRSSIGIDAHAAPRGVLPVWVRRVRSIQLSDGFGRGSRKLGRAAKAIR